MNNKYFLRYNSSIDKKTILYMCVCVCCETKNRRNERSLLRKWHTTVHVDADYYVRKVTGLNFFPR